MRAATPTEGAGPADGPRRPSAHADAPSDAEPPVTLPPPAPAAPAPAPAPAAATAPATAAALPRVDSLERLLAEAPR